MAAVGTPSHPRTTRRTLEFAATGELTAPAAPVVWRVRTGGNGLKLCQGRFRMDIRKKLCQELEQAAWVSGGVTTPGGVEQARRLSFSGHGRCISDSKPCSGLLQQEFEHLKEKEVPCRRRRRSALQVLLIARDEQHCSMGFPNGVTQ